MAQRKKTEGLNLAFLDIMSCGLGAVILVFMLFKHNVNDSSLEIENLRNDIQTLEEIKRESSEALKALQKRLENESASVQENVKNLAGIQTVLEQKQSTVENQLEELEKLKSGIAGIEINKKQDLLETERINEENYLLGLRVEGKRIGILVDASASMTHEKLIDIIKTKNGSESEKQLAEKWLRTKRVVEWLLARTPPDSEIAVVAFNNQVFHLGEDGWSRANEPGIINLIISGLDQLTPVGATNLQIGLQAMKKLSPSNLYVITDGLPTTGESRYKSLNPFASCNSLLGNSSTISGECRVKLFRQTLLESNPAGAVINVVLLPIEGDPDAVNEFWNWTSISGGLLISPANDWP